jgi:hypothetical protein
MRVVVLVLALVSSVAATKWSDTAKLQQVGDVGVNFHGPDLKYRGEVTAVDGTSVLGQDGTTYVAKSVMTGKDSYYPTTLPETLKTPYLVPDSTHPKLAFW